MTRVTAASYFSQLSVGGLKASRPSPDHEEGVDSEEILHGRIGVRKGDAVGQNGMS